LAVGTLGTGFGAVAATVEALLKQHREAAAARAAAADKAAGRGGGTTGTRRKAAATAAATATVTEAGRRLGVQRVGRPGRVPPARRPPRTLPTTGM